ncbi:unnamed protein product [Acanthoscelides obtectus]|uniref:Uncharacterized protein n=1 Tax=Acanthoscelides obtectus TaxID=200917 RepID=A0A9P0KLR8_ACAOB|nr:unnamed protein product [Acanthoscelides obtectus]CAK1640089.1 hypothetical protein AOBTE_LOCUS11543 [Acanthoscelides obtectus]
MPRVFFSLSSSFLPYRSRFMALHFLFHLLLILFAMSHTRLKMQKN